MTNSSDYVDTWRLAGIAAHQLGFIPLFCPYPRNTSLHTIRRYFVQLILHAIRVHMRVHVLSAEQKNYY
jgi:hypothetical protein